MYSLTGLYRMGYICSLTLSLHCTFAKLDWYSTCMHRTLTSSLSPYYTVSVSTRVSLQLIFKDLCNKIFCFKIKLSTCESIFYFRLISIVLHCPHFVRFSSLAFLNIAGRPALHLADSLLTCCTHLCVQLQTVRIVFFSRTWSISHYFKLLVCQPFIT